MYTTIIEKDLTYGQAMDKAIHEGKKVTRSIWGGYWELRETNQTTEPILIAVLRDNGGSSIATPYPSDKLAMDWMVVE